MERLLDVKCDYLEKEEKLKCCIKKGTDTAFCITFEKGEVGALSKYFNRVLSKLVDKGIISATDKEETVRVFSEFVESLGESLFSHEGAKALQAMLKARLLASAIRDNK